MTVISSNIVYSFDIFDTSITRTVMCPDHLHWAVGRELRQGGLWRRDDDAWRAARIAAERVAREKAGHREISLDEIFDLMSRQYGWTNDQARAAKAVELAAERAILLPVAAIQDRIRAIAANGGRYVFVSDTYFDISFIKDTLQGTGYRIEDGVLHLSSTTGKTKARGDLFEHLDSLIGGGAARIEHIGDHLRSDVINARKAGWQAKHFRDSMPTAQERLLLKAGGGNYISSVIAGAARATRLGLPASDEKSAVKEIGLCVAGPLLSGFVLWILLESRKQGISCLYFLARDGQILCELAKIIAAWAGWNIECRYILGSRIAFYLPSLQGGEDEIFGRLLSSQKSVAEELRELEFGDDEIAAICTQARCDPDISCCDPRAQALRQSMREGGWFDIFCARREDKGRALERYLEQEDFFGINEMAIVDLGWKGNLQRRLEAFVKPRRPSGLFGFYFGLRDASDLSGRAVSFCDTWHDATLIETMCLADHTSVRGFALAADCLSYPVGVEPDRDSLEWGVMEQQEAILTYAKRLFGAIERRLYPFEEVLPVLRQAGLEAFERFSRLPSTTEAEVYGCVRHAGGQLHADTHEIAPALSGFRLLEILFNKPLRRRTTYWFAGVVARSRQALPGRFLYFIMALLYCARPHLGRR